MNEKHAQQINDDYWKRINEDFDRLAENERMMQQKLKYEKQLEQRDAQLKMKDKLIEEQNNQNKLLKEQQKKAYQQMIDDGFSAEQIAKYFFKDDIQ